MATRSVSFYVCVRVLVRTENPLWTGEVRREKKEIDFSSFPLNFRVRKVMQKKEIKLLNHIDPHVQVNKTIYIVVCSSTKNG